MNTLNCFSIKKLDKNKTKEKKKSSLLFNWVFPKYLCKLHTCKIQICNLGFVDRMNQWVLKSYHYTDSTFSITRLVDTGGAASQVAVRSVVFMLACYKKVSYRFSFISFCFNIKIQGDP